MSFFLLLAHLETITSVCRRMCVGSGWMCEGIVGRCLCDLIWAISICSRWAQARNTLSFWIPKRWHLNLGFPTVGLFFSAGQGLTAIHRFPPAAQVRGCAEVSMSPFGYYVHATLIQHKCSIHPEVQQM